MPTAPIRLKPPRSPTARSPSANHTGRMARKKATGDQRFQASASTTIASNNSPANRSMMVPTRCGERCHEIGSVLSGRMVFMRIPAKKAAAASRRLILVAVRVREVQSVAGKFRAWRAKNRARSGAWRPKRNRRAALRAGGGDRNRAGPRRSAVAKAFGGAFPLRHIIGDHARGFHRGLAELGIAGDFALHALAFGMQQVAQAFEFGNQVLDFRKRSAGDALDQRVDVIDGGFVIGLEPRLGGAEQS